jgi:hypothetical protein
MKEFRPQHKNVGAFDFSLGKKHFPLRKYEKCQRAQGTVGNISPPFIFCGSLKKRKSLIKQLKLVK